MQETDLSPSDLQPELRPDLATSPTSPCVGVQSDAGSSRRRRREVAKPTPPATTTLADHPLARRNYRVATAAIEELVDLMEMCVRLQIPGALVHARPRMGKTHAVDYVALRLERHRPDVLVIRMSCEHHRTDYEGPFFSALLAAAGVRDESFNSNAKKRLALMRRLREQLLLRKGYIVVLLCDEAQRLSHHGLEWLRDVHDQLGRQGSRLIPFLVGQPQLLEHKAMYQLSGDEQIVSRFMIEQLHFRGITGAKGAATCLASHDCSRYPEDGGPTFTQFFFPTAFGAGLRLEHSGTILWNSFVQAHAAAQLPGPVEIQMDYFTRAVESVLLRGPDCDSLGLQLKQAYWERAVKDSGYIAAQQTVRIPLR